MPWCILQGLQHPQPCTNKPVGTSGLSAGYPPGSANDGLSLGLFLVTAELGITKGSEGTICERMCKCQLFLPSETIKGTKTEMEGP